MKGLKTNEKILCIIALATMLICLCACKEEVKREAINSRYTPAKQQVETDYKYEYSILKGDFVLVPDVHTVTRPASYEILYKITYDDGTTAERWRTVSREEYEAFGGGEK